RHAAAAISAHGAVGLDSPDSRTAVSATADSKPCMTDGAAATINAKTATIICASSLRIAGANDSRIDARYALPPAAAAQRTYAPGAGRPWAASSSAQAAAAKPALTAGTAHQCGFHKAAPAARATAAASHAGSGKRAGENASSVATNAAAMTAAAGRRVAPAASTTAASAQRMASAFESNTSPPTHAPSPI